MGASVGLQEGFRLGVISMGKNLVPSQFGAEQSEQSAQNVTGQGPQATSALWTDFLGDAEMCRCVPGRKTPTWMDGMGCLGVLAHILVPKEVDAGRLWVDSASPFPFDHHPVVGDATRVVHKEEERKKSTLPETSGRGPSAFAKSLFLFETMCS